MNCHVIHENTALLHHLFDVPQAQRVNHIPVHEGEHHLKRVMPPFEDLAQSAVDQTLTEIEHGRGCRLCLMKQNRHSHLDQLSPLEFEQLRTES